MKWLLRSPTFDEFIQLLAAWRVWLLGALIGGLISAGIYMLLPPPFRAQAVLLVDHNVEKVILQEESDNNRFFYLQQENDKLIQVAWSDQVLDLVSMRTGVQVSTLRSDILHLSQPGEGGWHLMAESRDPQEAASIASAWGQVFYETLQLGGPGISPLMECSLVQVDSLQPERSINAGVYIFFGSLAGAASLGLVLLLFHRKMEK